MKPEDDAGDVPGKSRLDSKTAQFLLAGVVGVCLAGFLSATRPREYRPVAADWVDRAVVETADAQPARRYTELAVRPWRSGAEGMGWSVDRESLAEQVAAPPTPERLATGRSSGPGTAAAVTDRAELRAYDGAPPTIPHPVRQRSASECQACHQLGLAIGTAQARRPSHPVYASCTQCHVVSASPVPPAPASAAALARNSFAGAAAATAGDRAWPGAPPVIPHTTWMRQECPACHGSAARPGLHTTHPERQSCTQCHPPAAALDQRVITGTTLGGAR